MIVGGGCFWCVEGAYKQIHGVESALPAYAGGQDPQFHLQRRLQRHHRPR